MSLIKRMIKEQVQYHIMNQHQGNNQDQKEILRP